ncbi:beta-1,4-galactosyltransferase 2 [Tachysurus ichikawai]
MLLDLGERKEGRKCKAGRKKIRTGRESDAISDTGFHQGLPYAGYFGGVSGLSKKQFLKINGFPNEYWGWGGEDDDIYNR